MAIKFACPHCGRPLNVKDELAGKKGPCPACKKIITIPSSATPGAPAAGGSPATGQVTPARTHPSAPPGPVTPSKKPAPPAMSSDEAEQAAAAVFADRPPPAPVSSKSIEFPCPYCDTVVIVTADLEGKQTPCTNPECRRIIRVPALTKKAPLDWRQPPPPRPSLARPETPAAPEGAWGSVAATGVSTEALSEAGAVLEPAERTPLTTWLRRGAVVAVVLVVIVGLTWWGLSSAAASKQDKLVKQALASVDAEKPKLGAQNDAVIFLAAGEYALHGEKKKGCATEARDHFRRARQLLAGLPPSVERDCLLIDVALLQVELGGDDDRDIAKSVRLRWQEAQRELAGTLDVLGRVPGPQGIAPYGPRAEALRLVCRKLLANNQVQMAYALAAARASESLVVSIPDEAEPKKQVDSLPAELPEALAAAGLEFLRADQKSKSQQLAESALGYYRLAATGSGKRPTLSPPDAPAVWALGLALGLKELEDVPKTKGGDVRLAGQAMAAATHGDLDEARTLAKTIATPEMQLCALLAIAEAGDSAPALDFVDGELSANSLRTRWQLLHLARIAAGRNWQRVHALTARVQDEDLRDQMELEALAGHLQEAKPELSFADGLTENSPVRGLAQLMVVRAAAARGDDMKSDVDAWDKSQRPFGYIALALGRQDRQRK